MQTIECPRFDEEKCILGRLCNQGHEWGTTGQTLRLKVKSGSPARCFCCANDFSVEYLVAKQKSILDAKAGLDSLPGEEWRAVREYEGLYEVSNMGRIKSVSGRIHSFRIMKQGQNKWGYPQVGLNINGKQNRPSVHRLVAQAFLAETEFEGAVVNHKNGIKTDNRAENLEWCTHQENTRHAFDVLGLTGVNSGNFQKGEEHKSAKLSRKQAIEIYQAKPTSGHAPKGLLDSLCQQYGVTRSCIHGIWQKRAWKEIHED